MTAEEKREANTRVAVNVGKEILEHAEAGRMVSCDVETQHKDTINPQTGMVNGRKLASTTFTIQIDHT